MSDYPSISNEVPIHRSLHKKFGNRQKLIIDLYISKIAENANLQTKELLKIISREIGLGRNTVRKAISDYKNICAVKASIKKKIGSNNKDKADNYEKIVIRRNVHNFWSRRELPTLEKVVKSVNNDVNITNTYSQLQLLLVLEELNFVYTRNNAILEKDDILLWRHEYIETIRNYRIEGRTIYYTNHTYVDAKECTLKTWLDQNIESRDTFSKRLIENASKPTEQGKRLAVLHIGSNRGFVQGGLLSFETKSYDDEINGDTFFDWLKNILPSLDDNCVIVMDNASYNSVKVESFPTLCWENCDIEKWLEDKGETFDKPIIPLRLMEIVNKIKPQYDKYVVDEYVKSHGKEVLRLPPYQYEFNSIDLAWESVKQYVNMNNDLLRLADLHKLIREGVEKCTPEMWKNFTNETLKEEDRFWDIDFAIDDVTDRLGVHIMPDTSDSSCSSSEHD